MEYWSEIWEYNIIYSKNISFPRKVKHFIESISSIGRDHMLTLSAFFVIMFVAISAFNLTFSLCGVNSCTQVLNEDLRLVVGQQERMINGANVWNLPVSYDKLGVRYRLWRDAVEGGTKRMPFTKQEK